MMYDKPEMVWKITEKGLEAANRAAELFASGLTVEQVAEEMELPEPALRLLLLMEDSEGVVVPNDY